MRMRRPRGARLLASALFLSAAALRAEAIRIAAERPDAACPTGARPPFGIVRHIPTDASSCVLFFDVPDLSDTTLDRSASALARIPAIPAVVLELSGLADGQDEAWKERVAFAIKKLSSAVRSGQAS